MKDAGRVPDLSRMLRDGLPYLTRNEQTEAQLALAVSLYAHSKSRHGQHDDRVKVSCSDLHLRRCTILHCTVAPTAIPTLQ